VDSRLDSGLFSSCINPDFASEFSLLAMSLKAKNPSDRVFLGTSLAVRAYQVICSVGRTTRLVRTCNIVARIIESLVADKSSDT
jgi:hypothetical protein